MLGSKTLFYEEPWDKHEARLEREQKIQLVVRDLQTIPATAFSSEWHGAQFKADVDTLVELLADAS